MGGGIETVTHRFERIGEGQISLTFGGNNQPSLTSTIAYTGLTSIRDNSQANQQVFQTGVGDLIQLADDESAGGESLFSSSLGVDVHFAAPRQSLVVETATNDRGTGSTLVVSGLGDQFDANVSIVAGDADTIRFSGPLDLRGGSLYASAGSVEVDGTITSSGGSVRLDAGASGTLLVSGTIDVSAATAGQTGGTVQLLGHHIGLTGSARIDASGFSGGGTILVGGDYHGANPDIRNASRVYVGPDAKISADSLADGNGGRVIVWSDEITRFYGHVSARGGSLSGDGGFVEVSSGQALDFAGDVDALAASGQAGTLLLEPQRTSPSIARQTRP